MQLLTNVTSQGVEALRSIIALHLFTLVEVDTIIKIRQAESIFTIAVDSGWRNALLVFGTVSFWTSTRKAWIATSVVSFFATTFITSNSVQAVSVCMTTICSITLIDIGTVLSLETFETVTSITSFTIYTVGIFRANTLLEAFVKIDTISGSFQSINLDICSRTGFFAYLFSPYWDDLAPLLGEVSCAWNWSFCIYTQNLVENFLWFSSFLQSPYPLHLTRPTY